MASFTRPFDPANVERQKEDMTLILPDPDRKPGDPVMRPGVARYAGATLILLHVKPKGAPFKLSFPVIGTVRNVKLKLKTPLPGGINQLLEVSPLPFSIERTLRALKPGLPTFYLGFSRGVNMPPDDELVNPTMPPTSVTGDTYVGVLFQDRVALAPWAWIELIRTAMQNSGEVIGASDWNSLALLYAGVRSLRVLDHIGRPSDGYTFQIRIRKTDTTFEGPWELTTGPDGDLEQAAITKPLPRAVGAQSSIFGAPGEQTELKWSGSAPTYDTSLPVQVLYETGLSSPPGQAILLPSGIERGHLQTLELTRWFAPPPATSALARYRTNSHVEPFVDGVVTFKHLVDDLHASASNGNGAHFAGWAFKDFPLIPGKDDTKLTELTKEIINGGGDVRFLVWKAVNYKQEPLPPAKAVAVGALVFLTAALLLADHLDLMKTDGKGFMLLFGGIPLGQVFASKLLKHFEETKGEQSMDIFSVLNDNIQKDIALWARYPARLIDNPVATPLPLNLDQFIDQFGAWHQKIQLVKRTKDADGNRYIAYVGGIDISSNRLDTPGHQIKDPFHDVHARITGPGAADVFKTWDERYWYHKGQEKVSLKPVFPPPAANKLPTQPAKHITQVGRTYFEPKNGGGTIPLPFAPSGECSTNKTLIRAIKAAREFIYIEDQYFTPNDSQPPGKPDTYFDALLDARNHCRRLLIIVPSETDQPFGDIRRHYLFNRLLKPEPEGWGNRVLIGALLRRPILPNPGRIGSEGRCVLMQNVGPQDGTDTIIMGPQARIPKTAPFWIWIDGELMLSRGQPRPTMVEGTPSMEVDVLRGPSGINPRWGAKARNHKKGAAVTMAQLKGIYVHSKIMVVDDIFVSIGSTNMNRRGLFHDGEINIFAIPEQLKAANDNPARTLRSILWAEHLGIPTAMGPSLLSDPTAAFELFRRSRYVGNRFTPFNALDVKPYLKIPLSDGLIIQMLNATAIGWAAKWIPIIWNTVSDPTSYADPDPKPGPTPKYGGT